MPLYVVKGLYKTNLNPIRNMERHGTLVHIGYVAPNKAKGAYSLCEFECDAENLLDCEYVINAATPRHAIMHLFNYPTFYIVPQSHRSTKAYRHDILPMSTIPIFMATLYIALVKNKRGQVSVLYVWIPPIDKLSDIGSMGVVARDRTPDSKPIPASILRLVEHARRESMLDKEVRQAKSYRDLPIDTDINAQLCTHMDVNTDDYMGELDYLMELETARFQVQRDAFYNELKSMRGVKDEEEELRRKIAEMPSIARRISQIEE